ncbi:tryptophan-rich sensory protein [Belliella sp. R4-6]|uniref:Tryptophan-rich sensory protein n=1 Tax=Belliella alkalica TaxID=1730871 RepID=A0ABS9V979_9BACT|nr:TspO/MBR family protein [Belliella alkalica]MCH7412977.1 tryptophan-rich sensory protein [Belliella alkalica]
MINFVKLILCILLLQIIGLVGATFTVPKVLTWYTIIEKPSFNPPSSVFGPTWTILYILMGVALFLIWKSEHPMMKKAIAVFGLQVFLNALWSPAFFGLESPLMGLIIIVPLWISILVCIKIFFPIQKWASILMIPYFLWVSFATVLNASIWYLN